MKKPLPRIGPRVPIGAGWTVQTLDFGRAGGFQRGYTKIFNPEGVCIDTALTPTRARSRAKMYKETAQ